MPNLNKVFLMGNLTKDPELRFTPQGSPVATLRIAVNRVFRNKEGERKEEVCYVNVQVWGRQAETCTQYLTKGKPVFVEGRLRNRNIEVGEGRTRSIVEVVADRVQFLERITPVTSVTEPEPDAVEEDESLDELEEEEF
ncbi:MAG TPA: single-stranded DNA-binding protein [bacterium]|nr:single-stranded DNA-binding protein [bacterium]HEX67614.1 single-stranded DNA-binding protein [bacterium]